ncbi:MAG: squalene--hopene cyclase [Planctomycetota bacterium]|nr:MAG: squalene--hopene cyclase [Planctomycetota bacterium]
MSVDGDRLNRGCDVAIETLLAQRTPAGYWVGELSTSALSTATAVMALLQVAKAKASGSDVIAVRSHSIHSLPNLIERGVAWLIANQNTDGGWGDTSKSFSNISTTMLCHAMLIATRNASAAVPMALSAEQCSARDQSISRAATYIDQEGGIPALIKRYGKDKTFSVPILTHCALAGLVPWSQVPRLPFELSCIPASWYAMAKFPVVSYALPALIAIGQVRHHHGKTWNPITRLIRWLARDRSLAVLQKIQPINGGFLEAAPLTSFVSMSLAGMGLADHPVVVRAIDFLIQSVRPDGSWPIDTNLTTWATTLAVNALENDLPEAGRTPILGWLLDQQYKKVHPYTNAAPGGWAWTDLPGGVPDADDTPGAILAVSQLANLDAVHADEPAGVAGNQRQREAAHREDCELAIDNGLYWLLGLQNRDGGFPTFCRGWGTLPFDRSSPDITAHSLRALHVWLRRHPLPEFDIDQPIEDNTVDVGVFGRIHQGVEQGFAYLERVQRPNGSWLPLWFGNQHVPNDENPVYGTSRVLRAFRDCQRWNDQARRGAEWLRSVQNVDGGWGGDRGAPSTVEETALALDALLEDVQNATDPVWRGVEWLLSRVEDGTWTNPSPIGFYFAKLWYFEAIYPLVWTVGALRKARKRFAQLDLL